MLNVFGYLLRLKKKNHMICLKICIKDGNNFQKHGCFWYNTSQTKKMCEKGVKEIPMSLIYVPGLYKTREMCKKVILERPFMLHLVLDQCKTQEICERATKLQPHALAFVPDQCKPNRCGKESFRRSQNVAIVSCLNFDVRANKNMA